jgi:hypothetical protein
MYRWKRILIASLALFLAAAPAMASDEMSVVSNAPAVEHYLRLTRDENKKPVALQTPIVRFALTNKPKGSPTVDLVAAIHIGDKSYYEQLNRTFKDYDAVLYELVAPEEASVPKPGDPTGDHPITLLQNGVKDLLGLEFQLKIIDYTRKNMVHADMSPDQFAESMHRRGETAMTMIVRMLGYALTQESNTKTDANYADIVAALFDKNRTLALKRIMAEQFEDGEGAMAVFDGPSGSTLISGRNQVALDVLRKEVKSGKQKIAIFYGAAHMPDLQKRLHDQFGMAPVAIRWLTAWSLKP